MRVGEWLWLAWLLPCWAGAWCPGEQGGLAVSRHRFGEGPRVAVAWEGGRPEMRVDRDDCSCHCTGPLCSCSRADSKQEKAEKDSVTDIASASDSDSDSDSNSDSGCGCRCFPSVCLCSAGGSELVGSPAAVVLEAGRVVAAQSGVAVRLSNATATAAADPEWPDVSVKGVATPVPQDWCYPEDAAAVAVDGRSLLRLTPKEPTVAVYDEGGAARIILGSCKCRCDTLGCRCTPDPSCECRCARGLCCCGHAAFSRISDGSVVLYKGGGAVVLGAGVLVASRKAGAWGSAACRTLASSPDALGSRPTSTSTVVVNSCRCECVGKLCDCVSTSSLDECRCVCGQNGCTCSTSGAKFWVGDGGRVVFTDTQRDVQSDLSAKLTNREPDSVACAAETNDVLGCQRRQGNEKLKRSVDRRRRRRSRREADQQGNPRILSGLLQPMKKKMADTVKEKGRQSIGLHPGKEKKNENK